MEKRLAAALTALHADDPEGAHLRAIADDPSDPARRDALRAWITAQGGERAELVALQERLHAGDLLSPKDILRVKKLLTANAKTWLGPLAPIVKEPRFERALLVECLVAPTGTKTGAAVGDPRWATVETVHCGGAMKGKGNDLLLHPALRSLRQLVDAPEALVEALLHDPRERPLEVITCDATHPRVLTDTLRAPGLPKLRDFSVSCWYRDDAVSKYTATWQPPSVLRPFLQSPLAARLSVLRWSVHDSFVGDVAAELDAHAPPGLTARVDLYFLSLSRGPDGRWSRVGVDIERVDDELKHIDSKLRTVLRLDPARVREVAVRVAAGQDASKLAAQVAAVRERFAGAEVTVAAG
jgi:hypothetical protein